MIILFHGAYGNPEENWIPYIRKNLEESGHEVIVPQFPVDNWDEVTKNGPDITPKNQNLDNWLGAFDVVKNSISKDKKIYAVAHSLGCVFILHLIERFGLAFENVIFVSPFVYVPNKTWQIDVVNKTFYKQDFDYERIGKHIHRSSVLYSDNDPYIQIGLMTDFADNLGSKKIEIKGAGHFNKAAGFTEFPFLLDLCKTNFT